MVEAESKQMYLERQFQRVVRERDRLRLWSWFWFGGFVGSFTVAMYGILHT